MLKVMSSFAAFFGVASLAFSSGLPEKEEEKPTQRIIFNLPQESAQERELNTQIRTTLLETSRDFALNQRLDTARLICLIDMYEAKIEQMRLFEKRNSADPGHATKLAAERKELRGKVHNFIGAFHSDWSSKDKRKIYEHPPLSMESQEKLIENMGKLFYRCPQSGSLEIDHASFGFDFFPLKVYFLKPENKRALLFTGSTVYQNPDNLLFEQSKLLSMRKVIPLPCTWFYPKDTYQQWVIGDNGAWSVDEKKWTNAFCENLLVGNEYVPGNWEYTLTQMSPAFVIGAQDLIPRSFHVYYGVDDETEYNDIDLLIVNAQGKAFYQSYCFHEGHSPAQQHLKVSLRPESFVDPEDFYRPSEEPTEDDQEGSDLSEELTEDDQEGAYPSYIRYL